MTRTDEDEGIIDTNLIAPDNPIVAVVATARMDDADPDKRVVVVADDDDVEVVVVADGAVSNAFGVGGWTASLRKEPTWPKTRTRRTRVVG